MEDYAATDSSVQLAGEGFPTGTQPQTRRSAQIRAGHILDRAIVACGKRVRTAMIRTGRGRCRWVWGLCYTSLVKGVATLLRVTSAEAVYVRGSLAAGEPVYGLSDVDLVAVAGRSERKGGDAERLRSRLRSLYEAIPATRDVVDVTVVARNELEEACLSPATTLPVDPASGKRSPRARILGNRSFKQGSGARPEGGATLYGPLRDWRHVAGSDPIASFAESPDDCRWQWAWLELQFFWKHTFRLCANPQSPHGPYFCTKMVAEPARLWLWLTSGHRPSERRSDVLKEALDAMPEGEETLRLALAVRGSLFETPAPPLSEAVGWLTRVTSRVTARLMSEVDRSGTSSVLLVGSDYERPADPNGSGPPRPNERRQALPLLDWRARVVPGPLDETFEVKRGDPADPGVLAEAALSADRCPYPALVADDLLVLPNSRSGVRPLATTAFRAVQCPATDPVSFALMRGERTATFPALPGWSAGESAQRAVLEHRAWLDRDERDEPSARRRLEVLFSAARAAVFAESLDQGHAELPLTVAATAKSLGARDHGIRDTTEAAYDHYLASRTRGDEPPEPTVTALGRVVRRLDAYARSH